jgi:hypothetical protein
MSIPRYYRLSVSTGTICPHDIHQVLNTGTDRRPRNNVWKLCGEVRHGHRSIGWNVRCEEGNDRTGGRVVEVVYIVSELDKTYSNVSSIVNLVSIFRCSSSTVHPVYVRRVTSLVLVCSHSSHRHSYTSYLYLSFYWFITNNCVWETCRFLLLVFSLSSHRYSYKSSLEFSPFWFIINKTVPKRRNRYLFDTIWRCSSFFKQFRITVTGMTPREQS